VVVLDRQLPGMEGGEVLEALRERGFDCQVIVASGVKPDLDLVRMEFDAYLVKPVSKDELRAAVRHALTRASYDDKLREFY
ncbi:response regulator, partial [Chryseobacterium gambrini]